MCRQVVRHLSCQVCRCQRYEVGKVALCEYAKHTTGECFFGVSETNIQEVYTCPRCLSEEEGEVREDTRPAKRKKKTRSDRKN